jgi:hypothetical protein
MFGRPRSRDELQDALLDEMARAAESKPAARPIEVAAGDVMQPSPELSDAAQNFIAEVSAAIREKSGQAFKITAREANQRAVEMIRAGTVPLCYQVKNDKKTTQARMVAAIRMGADLGMPPSTALDKIILLEGRYCITCAGALALAHRSGLVDRVQRSLNGIEIPDGEPANTLVEFTEKVTADYRIWRRGQSEPHVGRYSVRDARRAKLWQNPRRPWWMNDPAAMLAWRAASIALRHGFSDCLGGLAILEDIRDLPAAPAAVTNADFLVDAPVIGEAISTEGE